MKNQVDIRIELETRGSFKRVVCTVDGVTHEYKGEIAKILRDLLEHVFGPIEPVE